VTPRQLATWALVLSVLLGLLVAPAVEGQAGDLREVRYGEVISADPTIVVVKPTGRSTRTGATAGAIAGAALADRGDGWAGALIGGAIGGAIGRSADKKKAKKEGWALVIRLDSGEEVAVQLPHRKDQFKPGDWVRLLIGHNGTDVQRVR